MQRLFSSFPAGLPGLGLLLLRSAVGLSLVTHGGARVVSWQSQGAVIGAMGAIELSIGLALAVGALTPVAATLALLDAIGSALPLVPAASVEGSHDLATLVLVAVMAAAVLLLGPGAWSVDARLFGRREIQIPRSR